LSIGSGDYLRLGTASWPALLWASGRACAAGVLGSMCTNVHACVPPFIGHLLDTKPSDQAKLLILLALPRGLEPLFSP
jgi:hypothetical protein